MKKHLSFLLTILLLWAGAVPGLAEEAPETLQAQVTNGAQTMDFHYPAGCEMEADGTYGTFVHLNDDAYVVVVLLEEEKSVTQLFEETKAPDMEILRLSQDLQLLGWPGKVGYGLPGWPSLDIVEVGVTLADGSGMIVQSTCPAGDAEIYGVLVTILASITDAQPLQRYLAEVWLPRTVNAVGSGLSQMTYIELTDAYTQAYGTWWDWDMSVWQEYSAALRQLAYISSRTGQAIAQTDYVLPPKGALPDAEATATALLALDVPGVRYYSSVFFQTEGRVIRKVSLTLDMTVTYAVEMDAMTGEVLGVYERIPADGTGQFFVPHALWEATPNIPPPLWQATPVPLPSNG